MPNAGVFTNQSKVRPGAYINFKAERSVNVTGAERGIVAIPLKLGWGEGIVKVNASEISDGTFTNKLACFITDEAVAPLVEAMKYAESALVYNLVSGGEKATATVGGLSVSAKHAGTRGNKLSVAVLTTSSTDVFSVVTMLDGVVKNKQEVKAIAELKENDFVSFSGEGDLSANAGVKLTGGSDGSLSVDKYTAFLAAIKNIRFNAVALPMYDLTSAQTFNATVPTYVKELCDAGNKVTAVVYNYPSANCEHIVSVDQGYKTATSEVNVDAFVGTVAGMMAGTAANVSNTYRLITGATEIVNPKTDAEIEDGLRNGCFMLSQRIDGGIVVESDINTLTTINIDQNESFKKNRVIRVLDDIAMTIRQTFENEFIGQVTRNENGKNALKASIVAYFNALQNMEAIQNFTSDDVNIVDGETIDSVVVNVTVQPLDAMEKMYMSVTVA